MATHFHPEILFSREEGCLLPRKGAIPSDNWREITQKWLELRVWLQTRVLATLCALLRCREPKEMLALDKCFWGYGYAWTWLIHYDDDATFSHNNENRNSLRASSPFKGYREKSRASGTRKETREQGAGKESESSSFPPLHAASPLTRAFACHSNWKEYVHSQSQSITFLGSCSRSLFGKPVYFRN